MLTTITPSVLVQPVIVEVHLLDVRKFQMMKTESQKIYVSSKYLAAPTQLTRLTVTNVNAFASQTISEIHEVAAVESAT
jgi:hypothetical protein